MHPHEKTALRNQCDAIHTEWRKCVAHATSHGAGAHGITPYDKPNGYLKRAVYQLVRDCIDNGAVELLQRFAEDTEYPLRPSPHNQNNPFYWGIMAVCMDDNRISRNNRSKFANELLYAHKHNVPSNLLVGFIYQIGTSEGLRARLLNRKMEKWHNEN